MDAKEIQREEDAVENLIASKKKRPGAYWIIIVVTITVTLLLNLLSLSNRFSDYYIDKVFPLWINVLGRFSNLFGFSLGEKLIVIGIFLVVFTLIIVTLLIFLRKKEGYRKFAKLYLKGFLAILCGVVLIMTLNCSILYGCSELSLASHEKEYTVDELESLRNMIVEKCNELSAQMDRDEDGYVVWNGDMYEETVRAMQGISNDYPRFKGYYPKAKPISASVFMTQTYTSGVYFPFSMEANYNNIMYIVNYPAVICHEYSHLKGYILEDESNFFAYLACVNSDDAFLQYSGYQSVLGYVNESYYNSVSEEQYFSQVAIDELVLRDYIFLTPENWEMVEEMEKQTGIDTETIDDVSDTMTDNSLKFFGVEDGILSYDRVTELLLEYYSEHEIK